MDNSVIQFVHVKEGRALNLHAHLDIASASFRRMYGIKPGNDAGTLAAAIENISPPMGSSLVRLTVSPVWRAGNCDLEARFSVELCGRLLYPGYELWHSRLKAVATPYDGLFGDEPCLTTNINAFYAESYARSRGFDAAVKVSSGCVAGLAAKVWCCDAHGVEVRECVGQWPLFMARDGVLHTPSCESGAIDSVELGLGIDCAEKTKYGEVILRTVSEDELETFDEIFAITPQGIISLLSCGSKLYFNLAARKISTVLSSLSVK